MFGNDTEDALKSDSIRVWSVTSILIVVLLIIIVVIMIYNYWIVYSNMSKRPLEYFDPIYGDKREHPLYDSSAFKENSNTEPANSMVNSVENRISQYKEGDMSNVMKKYYDVHNTQMTQIEKSELPEKGIVKLLIYHMPGCMHCHSIMNAGNNGEKSQFNQLLDMFKNDDKVKIYDYQLGRDKEASKYQSFPTIMLVTTDSVDEYQGSRDATSMAKTIVNKKT